MKINDSKLQFTFELDKSCISELWTSAIGLIVVPVFVILFLYFKENLKNYINWHIVIGVYAILLVGIYFYYIKQIFLIKNKYYNRIDVDIEEKYLVIAKEKDKEEKIYFTDVKNIKTKRINRATGQHSSIYYTGIFITLKNGLEYNIAISDDDSLFKTTLNKFGFFK